MSIKIMKSIDICNYVIQHFSSDNNAFFESAVQSLRVLLKSFRKQMEKDYPIKIQDWLNQDILRKKDIFTARIMELLQKIHYENIKRACEIEDLNMTPSRRLRLKRN